ncbi:MAG TPA: NAD(P)/FAD-dependent oxidoreductase [Solirubrobacteraceae bacterium]|jgi:dihydrolipoamide dehydrogenase
MSSSKRYDVVVLGSGPGGRGVAKRLAQAEMRVAMVESELVGGECPFWACIPSKALLRPVEVVSEAHHAPGVAAPALSWDEVSSYRDYMNSGLDDSDKFAAYSQMGIEIIRGEGRIAGPGQVEVNSSSLETERIVVATGTVAAIPDVHGLTAVDYWTNREATSFHEVPQSTIVLGGGPVGIELGQLLARYGSEVTIVESADRILAREHPSVGEMLAELLRSEEIDVRTGVEATQVESGSGITRLTLGDGSVVEGERLLVATGRTPRVEGLGLEHVGVEWNAHGIKVDQRCRAAPGVWAVGDVTGVAPFTHVAAYQARLATADIQGREARADYRAIPRVVFSDPEVATVGLTPEQADDAGLETTEVVVGLDEIDRTETYGKDLTGCLGLLADRRQQVLVGAWAVGPLASEWIHTAVIAIKAEVPIDVLRDTVIQFPTFAEAMQVAAERLPAD